jgi:hypothetical protein
MLFVKAKALVLLVCSDNGFERIGFAKSRELEVKIKENLAKIENEVK